MQALKDMSYTVRRYYIDKFYIENSAILKDKFVLDIGGHKAQKRGDFDVNTTAKDVKYVNIDSKTEPDYCCDAVNIPVQDASFDIVILSEVLEHLVDPVDVLKEAYRA